MSDDDPAERARGFEILVRAYWRPVYTHVRARWRRPADDAQELTQAFFARAFEKRWFARYDAERARFRTFLKTCLDRFVMEDARDERRQKRGGDAVRLSLDFESAEREMSKLAAPGSDSVEDAFDREWVRVLLARAVDAFREVCKARKKEASLRVFERYVLDQDGDAGASYQSVAAELGIKVTDVTNYLAWSRREFRRIVLEELRELTASEEEFQLEVRAVLGQPP